VTRKDFVERSIRGTLAFFKEAIFADETASRHGVMQSLDPRFKMMSILLLILLVLFTRRMAVLGILYLLCLSLAALSQIRLGFFLKRTWIFIPLFSVMIAIPALFSFVSPGKTVISVGRLCITQHGIRAAGFFVGRVITSVSWTVLLSMTTRHFALLRTLRFLRVPQVFVMVLGICYRYIYLFVEIIESTHRAIQSRIGSAIPYQKGQKIVAWNIAHLWTRSYTLNEQVYNAMISRGFRGEPVVLDHARAKPTDWLWLLGSILMVLLLAVWEHGGKA